MNITCKKELFGKIHRHESACCLREPAGAALSARSVAACAGCEVQVQGCDWSADPFLYLPDESHRHSLSRPESCHSTLLAVPL